MKRTCSFILLLAFISIGPVLSFAHEASTDLVRALTHEEESPDVVPVTVGTGLIGNGESPYLVAEQTESDREKEPEKMKGNHRTREFMVNPLPTNSGMQSMSESIKKEIDKRFLKGHCRFQ